ncbi:phosphate signaling complex protein PhoU [Cohnella phaseoli]|uniref:Phosphate-specific transport system accessory protein PhoU n=1 Tax=Cohnella phaseoli TaxID=456490 RepID=A0A3D9JPY5_9BACL|nr:phosphate signaling complex protein PhoU [Cohnella phaseoli]RED76045.1 PhoU-like phosphate uptake regulator [Cohnella phaseoli]
MDYRTSMEKMQFELRRLLDQMGEHVQQALEQSVHSLEIFDQHLAKQIVDQDSQINELENEVLELTAIIIATQQPVSKDMRKTLIAIRMAHDLERMADLSVDIAKVVIRLEQQVDPLLLVGITEMKDITLKMIKGSMESYDREDANLAEEMAELDHKVDRLYGDFLRRNSQVIQLSKSSVTQGLSICFVGRFLERIADHATNIGENVIYLTTNRRLDLNR